MKDKNGRELKDGDRLWLANGAETEYLFDGTPNIANPHYIGEPFQCWLTDAQAAIVLRGCEVVAPLEFEGKVEEFHAHRVIFAPCDSGIQPGDTVVVRKK